MGRLVLAAVVALAWCAETLPAAGEPATSPRALLLLSHSMNSQFVPVERAFHLLRLSEAANRIAPDLTKPWAEELFRTCEKLPPSWDRAALLKNGVIAIAAVDPSSALEHLGSQAPPVWTDAGVAPEDLRASAARSVFRAVWARQGHGASPSIRRVARRIGKTGLYPFGAVAPLIKELQSTNQRAARDWTAEAIAFFRNRPRFEVADTEYQELIRLSWDGSDALLRRSLLEAAIESLSRPDVRQENATYEARLHFGNGVARFNTPRIKTLAGLLPLVRDIDPAWAARLVASHPELAPAGTQEATYAEAVTIHRIPGSTASSADLLRVVRRGFEAQKLGYLETLLADDWAHARSVAQELTEPDLRCEAFAKLAIANPAEADGLSELARRELAQVVALADQLRCRASILEAAVGAGDPQDASRLWLSAMQMGEELFLEQVDLQPLTPAYKIPVMEDLRPVVVAGIRLERVQALRRVQSVTYAPLRAYLLIYAAEALAEAAR